MAKIIDIVGKVISGEWGNEDSTGNGTPVLRTTNFTNNGILNYDSVVKRDINKNVSEKMLRKGDIIIEKSGGTDKTPVGRVVYFEGEDNKYLFNNFTGLLRVKDPTVWYPKYVFYSLFYNYLAGGTKEFENRTTGIHNLKTDAYVRQTEIKQCDITKQIEYVNKIDKVTELISAANLLLAKLDELVKAKFVEMFGEKSCKKLKWNDIFGTKTGKLDANAMTEDGEYPFFTCAKEVYRINKYAFDQEALLLAGNNAAGKYDVKHYAGKFNAYQRTYVLTLKDASWSYKLFRYQLEQKLEYLQSVSLGGLTKYLTLKILNELEFIVPPIELQNQFADYVCKVDGIKDNVRKSLNNLETLKKSLMQEYFG